MAKANVVLKEHLLILGVTISFCINDGGPQ